MSTMVPMYGFGGGGGKGAALTVTAPAGCTVTVSKDGKSKTKIADAQGLAVFKGLETGQWAVTITDGEQIASKNVTIVADYNKQITFFSATIHITYPAGSTCTATDGVTTLTAPDTSGTWACVVGNKGTWTFKITNGTETAEDTVEITTDGQGESLELDYNLVLFDNGKLKNGVTIQDVSGVEAKAIIKDDHIEFSGGNKFGFYFNPPYDLSKYRTLEVDVQSITPDYLKLGVSTSPAYSGKFEVSKTLGHNAPRQIVNLDISSINDSAYFLAYMYIGQYAPGAYFYSIRFLK